MNRSIVGYLLAAVLTLCGCAQGDQEPAELATEFKNHVSFLLDSVEWVAGSDGSVSVIDEVIAVEIGEEQSRHTFLLTAWRIEKGASSSISLFTDSMVVGQRIELNGAHGRASFTSKTSTDEKPSFLTSDAVHTGSMTITAVDSITKRVIGTFECKLGTLNITNGKFDARYSAPKAM